MNQPHEEQNQNSFTFGNNRELVREEVRQEALEEMSSSSINTNDLTDVKRSETEEMNQTHNHYISLSTSKTLMGPDIISPKVREDPISLIDT